MIIIEEEIWTWMRYNGKLYKGEFQVSNLGNIRSVDRYVNCHSKYGTPYKMFKKGQEISQNIYNGYLQACTSENGKSRNFFVHRAVLESFIPNPDPEIYTDVNHKDENKSNNRLDNLEWTTHKENVNYGTAIERHAQKLRDKFIPIVQLNLNGNITNVYYNTKEIEDTKVYKATRISYIVNKHEYIYKNYFWIRLDEYNSLSQENLTELINKKVSEKEFKVYNQNCKPVIQMSKDMEFIREYPSVTIAASVMRCSKQAIQQSIGRKNGICAGYKWMYKNS